MEKVAIKIKGNLKQVKKAIRNLAATPKDEPVLREADFRARSKKKVGA